MHILKLSEWNSNNRWYVSDVEELGKDSGKWWYVANLLSITPVDYIKKLIYTYKATINSYNIDKDVLIFYFNTQTEARKFKNDINSLARKKNFMICK